MRKHINDHPNDGFAICQGEPGGYSLLVSRQILPDFIAEADGRTAIIEYKGERDELRTEQHKKTIGDLWADRSGGQCVQVVNRDWAKLEAKGVERHNVAMSITAQGFPSAG